MKISEDSLRRLGPTARRMLEQIIDGEPRTAKQLIAMIDSQADMNNLQKFLNEIRRVLDFAGFALHCNTRLKSRNGQEGRDEITYQIMGPTRLEIAASNAVNSSQP